MTISLASGRDPTQAFTERVRFVSTVLLTLFLLGWALWFWPYDDLLDRSGTPLGADFSIFYVAGQMTATGKPAQLYDQAAHQARLHDLFPGIDPQFALPYPGLFMSSGILEAPRASKKWCNNNFFQRSEARCDSTGCLENATDFFDSQTDCH